ncbi:MAG: metallophosphatase family protein [Gemmatimonadota bacterium]|nr:metallophosphatase family protein [Gemmatimonadota bacterium]
MESGLFALMADPKAEEWPDRVGVVGGVDGSAKHTTRLLESSNWVIKTDLAHVAPDPGQLRARSESLVEMAGKTDLWHPKKVWFLMRVADGWLPASACPRLRTLRDVTEWSEKITRWTRMIEMGLETTGKFGIHLDLNPSNFGFEEKGSSRLYYLDDEYYQPHGLVDFGEAVVARIPEEPQASEDEWSVWGGQLQQVLNRFCSGVDDFMKFMDGIRGYPQVEEFRGRRTALLEGFSQGHPLLDPVERKRRREAEAGKVARIGPRTTMVFSDAHANLPALEAVLKAASDLKVDDYLFLGDAVGYGPHPREVIDRITALPGLVAIKGNHDHAIATGEMEDGANRIAVACAEWSHAELDAAHREWLGGLPLEYRVDPVIAVHGAPVDPQRFYGYVYELTYKVNLEHLEGQGLSLCWYGHTHVPFIHRKRREGECEKLTPSPMKLMEPDQVVLVNPGSVGLPRDGDPRASFAIYDWDSGVVTFHRVSYPIHLTIAAVNKAGLPDDLVYRLEVGR